MIPYFEQPRLHLGPITIHAFGVLVAGCVIGIFCAMAVRESGNVAAGEALR